MKTQTSQGNGWPTNLKKQKDTKQINKLRDEAGIIQMEKAAIHNIITIFNGKLYNAQEVDSEEITNYLEQANLPKIPGKNKKNPECTNHVPRADRHNK